MMHNAVVDIKSSINKERLAADQYTVSLLKEAMSLGLIEKHEMYRIQEELMLLLKDLIMRRTKGDSTSVQVETAEKLLKSAYYAIDACIGSFDSPEEGLAALKSLSVNEIYQNGMKLVAQCYSDTKKLYRELLAVRMELPLIAYNDTINKGIPEFFTKYEIVFEAHETMASIDYPLAIDNTALQGAYYMKNFLETLIMEAKFCRLFEQNDIRKLMVGYGRLCGIDHKEPLVNIFELVINNSIFSILSGNELGSLLISGTQYELLCSKLGGLQSGNEVNFVISKAIERLKVDLCLVDQKLLQYIERYAAVFVQRITNAIQSAGLHNLIIIDNAKGPKTTAISFEDGSGMTDSDFRLILRKINESGNVSEKVEIIRSRISSLVDFIDVLNANCLFGDEYAAVFAALSDTELAVLGKAAFAEAFKNNPPGIRALLNDDISWEAEWQEEYIKFLVNLDEERINAIEQSTYFIF